MERVSDRVIDAHDPNMESLDTFAVHQFGLFQSCPSGMPAEDHQGRSIASAAALNP